MSDKQKLLKALKDLLDSQEANPINSPLIFYYDNETETMQGFRTGPQAVAEGDPGGGGGGGGSYPP